MTGGFFALFDDIAALMDDVAVMTKVATKKTAGILSDDLAVNAYQLTGVSPERELPIVWQVVKGSLLNKLILVPIALTLSAFLPQAIAWLLLAGGLYLCFEGAENVYHFLFDRSPKEQGGRLKRHAQVENIKIEERKKIKGAVTTDFILSAEIVIIALGTLQEMNKPFVDVVIALCFIAVLITLAVYGVVAVIVKFDDFGLRLVRKYPQSLAPVGRGILWFAPKMIKSLTVIGTFAMFVVGGHIWVKHIPLFTLWVEAPLQTFPLRWQPLVGFMLDMVTGVVIGGLAVVIFLPLRHWLTPRHASSQENLQ